MKIEKNVPIPSHQTPYPFGEMDVGDSFLVTDRTPGSVSNAACQYGKRHGKKFITRSMNKGIRVWRMK